MAERMKVPRAAGLSATLGGQVLAGTSLSGDAAARSSGAETREAETRAKALSGWLNGKTRDDDDEARGIGTRTVTGRELVLGSAFSLTGEAPDGGTAGFWGRAAVSGFDASEGELTLDGEVTTGLLGADYARGRWLMGLIASHSRGEGGYRGAGEGTVSSTLTGDGTLVDRHTALGRPEDGPGASRPGRGIGVKCVSSESSIFLGARPREV